jgi:ABC-type sugar transport system ATPase subunit
VASKAEPIVAFEDAVPVTLEDVSKRYGAVTALHATSLRIEAGEFVTLLGPSGCGKSTTLNLIAGLEAPSGGSIRIGDIDVTRLPPQQRDVAMVFQNYALYPHLTAFDNIAFPLRLKRRNLGPEQVRSMVERTASSLGIGALLGRRPSELSGGQRQRVALGRALVRQPRVFLLDEPLSNLDNQLRVEMRSELKELHERVGATMIYVTHDQAEAMILSDRVVVMRDGVVQQIGPPLALYREPANVFVAGFLGERGMNLIPGSLDVGEAGRHFVADGVRLDLTAQAPAIASVVLGAWPEDLVIAPAGDAQLTGKVRTTELMGDRVYVKADVAGVPVTALAPADFRAVHGSTVGLRVAAPDAVRLFDATSGAALPAS